MVANISSKSSWLRCFASLIPAIATAILLCILLDGPRLGPFYDLLLKLRPSLPISREILIINSAVSGTEFGDDILEPGTAASLLYTMTEMEAQTLIIQVPILGLSAGGNAGEEEILDRFDEEFSILSLNIRNLFDAIRMGSVAPNEAARYVGELVELSEKGKERLVSSLVRRDEEGVASMEKAAAFFEYARRPGDLRVQLIRSGGNGRPGVLAERNEYSKATRDRDGVLRRIAPVIIVPLVSDAGGGERTMEHIIYAALKSRVVEEIPLDRSGALLFEVPKSGEDFRRIGISDFLAYDEADRSLRRLLAEGETLGIFQNTSGENNSGFLYDYALSIREEPVSSFSGGNAEKKAAWIDARKKYFASLEDFLSGPAEMNLVRGYEEIISTEPWNTSPAGDAALAKMTAMRDSLIETFAVIREKHNEVLQLRKKLENALSASFCILGNTPDVEVSALLANGILTGRVITPGGKRILLLISLLPVFFICFSIKSLGPAQTFGAGFLLCILLGIIFSLLFIFTGYWFDPYVPAAAGSAAVLFSFFWIIAANIRYNRFYRLAFGPFVSRSCLKSIIQAGKPLPSQLITARAAIVAIKNPALPQTGDSPVKRIKAAIAFQQTASDLLKKAGGTISGMEEDLLIACFGSPLERVFLKKKKNASPYEDNINSNAAPALKAVDFVSEIARHPDCRQWYFGLDIGNCTFTWTAISGYFALGMPVQKAKILSRLASRYSSQVVISAAVNEAFSELASKRLDVLKVKEGGIEETFYRLQVG